MTNHVGCLSSFPGIQEPTLWMPTVRQNLPWEGFDEGDRVIRPGNPQIGILEHVCADVPELHGIRAWRYYGYVLWIDAGRRGEKTFDMHTHCEMYQLRHATPENLAAAETVVADRAFASWCAWAWLDRATERCLQYSNEPS